MADTALHEDRHPIGTLVIIAIYAALFLAGWLAVYVRVYLSRGPVTA